MTGTSNDSQTIELREISWLSIGLCGIGGLALVISLIMLVLFLVKPPPNPPSPVGGILITVGSAAVLGLGIYLIGKSRIGLRLSPEKFEFPSLGASVAWSEIKDVEVMNPGDTGELGMSPVLLLMLTDAGRAAVGNRQLSNSDYAAKVDPPPDVCIKLNFWNFGPGIDTSHAFVNELRRRIAGAAASSGSTNAASMPESPALPELDAPLEERDMSETGPSARVYIHENCGAATIVSGSSFYWVANPLRYASGTMCSQCGVAYDVSVRWEDTGETLNRFRSRMRRHTPAIVKLLQFLVIPSLVGVATIFLFPAAGNIPPLGANLLGFGIGMLACNMLFLLTPLAGLIPSMFGVTYHKYR